MEGLLIFYILVFIFNIFIPIGKEEGKRVGPEALFEIGDKESQRALLILLAMQIKADGRVMPAEMEKTKAILDEEFDAKTAERLFGELKEMANSEQDLDGLFAINQIRQQVAYRLRLNILKVLCKVIQADGIVTPGELMTIRDLALKMGIRESVVNYYVSHLHINGYDEKTQRDRAREQQYATAAFVGLSQAYATLGLSTDASASELKTAFRKCAMKHHPDRFATASAEEQREAETKFKEIVEAYERILSTKY